MSGSGTEPRTSTMDEALERFATLVAREATEKIEAQIPGLVARFADHGVDVIVLKGPVTRRRLYAEDERRPVADIDVLVDASAFRRATRALLDAGHHRFDRHGHSDAFAGGADDADVDLHLTLPYVTRTPRQAFRVFADHRSSLEVAGTPVPVLDAPAHVVHLAIHATVNRFDPGHRSFTEWARGLAGLSADEVTTAETVADRLGVRTVWDLAVRALADDEDREVLLAARPTWEAVPRVGSVRGFLRSGVPAEVKWRDLQRLVTLQLSDTTLNEWRADRGGAPLPSGSLQIRVVKIVRLVTVSISGLARIVGVRRSEDADHRSAR